mgnify:CR=1 FL=1
MSLKRNLLIPFTKIVAFLTYILLPVHPVKATDLKDAETYVYNLSNRIIQVVDSKARVEEKQKQLLELFEENASTLTISRAALGPKWRSLNESTKKEFTAAFTHYIIKKYGKQFEDFSGARLTVERSIDAGKRGILVHTRLIMPATSPISVKWQVWRKTKKLKLVDIIIEDISMLTMEREEIKNRLAIHKNDIPSLITDLKRN